MFRHTLLANVMGRSHVRRGGLAPGPALLAVLASLVAMRCGGGPVSMPKDAGEGPSTSADGTTDASAGAVADAAVAGDSTEAAPLSMPVDATFEAAEDAPPSSPADAPSAEAGDVVRSGCDPNAPFGPPVLLAGMDLNTANEEGGPHLTPDELTLFLSGRGRRDGTSVSDLFVAHRPAVTSPFEVPVALPSLDSTGNEFDPSTSADALVVFFTSDRPSALGGADIWTATRANVAADFGAPIDMAAPFNSAGNDAQPFESADGTTLWFSSDRAGGAGGYDIYEAPLAGGPATRVAELASADDDFCPTPSADGLLIFFSSSRPDGAALGGRDIWSASRASVSDPFSNVHDESELNSAADDFPGWLSADGCRLYMSSTRPGVGSEDIYVATRTR